MASHYNGLTFHWLLLNIHFILSSSSTTQQSWNLLRYLIIASELFQVLMSASTDPGACVCGWSGIGCCYCSCADTLLHRIYVVNIILAVKVSFAKLTPRFCPSQYFFLIILIILIIMSSPKNYGLQVSKDVCITRVYYKMISEPYP